LCEPTRGYGAHHCNHRQEPDTKIDHSATPCPDICIFRLDGPIQQPGLQLALCDLTLSAVSIADSGATGNRIKHNGPLGGASGRIAFKSRLLSRDATGGGSSRPEALDYYPMKGFWELDRQEIFPLPPVVSSNSGTR
jgi:hypothetical protein